jgi:beta-lactam-binding protein with PASTA domain
LSISRPEAGKVSVPGLTSALEASDTLFEAGLKLGRWDEVPSGSVPKDSVIAQDPLQVTEAEPDTTVNILVSTGPASPEYDDKQKGVEKKAQGKQK